MLTNVTSNEYANAVEQILNILKNYGYVFFLLKILELTITAFIIFTTIHNKHTVLSSMEEIYIDLQKHEILYMFYISLISTCFVSIIFYPLGFAAIHLKNVKIMKTYTNFALFSAILTIFLMYVNV
jgi:hypothetical protein